ncbi:hypothetical protein VKT23_014627 [Stygiomarasmius scandens]|uniref:DUF6589 domain-containing protein n=1 Tax=Marasmiellus scandens TaxID=2682957 RepID=A0ABR1J354_9AGAR
MEPIDDDEIRLTPGPLHLPSTHQRSATINVPPASTSTPSSILSLQGMGMGLLRPFMPPPKKKTGRKITKNTGLDPNPIISQIPTSAAASDYTLLSHFRPPPHILPTPMQSANPIIQLPTPITPSNQDTLLQDPDPDPLNIPANVASSYTPPTNTRSYTTLSNERQRKPKRDSRQKLALAMEYIIKELNYDSIPDFFNSYLEQIPRGSSNVFDTSHRTSVLSFLQGRTKVKPVEIVQRMFDHRYSFPSYGCENKEEERSRAYSPTINPLDISYARCSLSSWATQVVGNRVYRDMRKLTHPELDPEDGSPQISARLLASANARTRAKKGVKLVAKEDLLSFKISDRAEFFKQHAPLVWYLTECMAAPRKDNEIVERKRRPPAIVQVAALSSFCMARNQYSNGYWAMQNGIWHIACQSHVDVKRIDCHKGASVHDTTARAALATIAEGSLGKLRTDMKEGTDHWKMLYRWVVDNVQQFIKVWEGGIGRDNLLISGCAGTAILMDDVAPGAFDLDDHIERVLRNDSAELTVQKLWASIDWDHISGVQSLHVLLALLVYVPSLNSMENQVNELFRGKYAIHRMREGRKTTLVPLGTNSEREIETEGMKRALHDFFQQSGLQPECASHLIAWVGGDGGSVLAMDRAKRYLAQHYDPDDPESDYKILHNLLPTIGIWHTQATNQNVIAENHFGPAVTNDPSALSRSASCANFKRPTNFKDCSNYYPLHRCMSTCWNAQVLDCWQHELGFRTHEEMLGHFEQQAKSNNPPKFDNLLAKAICITSRWVSLESVSQALSSDMSSLSDDLKFPMGDPYESGGHAMNVDGEQQNGKLESFKEKEDFEGDRVLANSILFKWEYSLWLELAYAVPEGDIGRVWEIMKVWTFIFAGSGNSNYRDLLLEMYCLFHYKSSTNLKDAIWNNWLVNVTGELGKWIADDLLQEHYNRWLEDLLQKSNGNFDDTFLRSVLSPNVEFFLRLKEEFEGALGLHHRSKSHTSPHLRAEYQQLLTMYREEQLHTFRKGRSMGHAATDFFNKGFMQLKGGALKTFLEKQNDHIETLRDMDKLRKNKSSPLPTPPPSSPLPASPVSSSPRSTPEPTSSSRSSQSDNTSNNGSLDGRSNEGTDLNDGNSSEYIEGEEADLLAFKLSSSRLRPGLETMPRIDQATGWLVSDWMSEEELHEILDDEEADENDEDEDKFDGKSDDEENWGDSGKWRENQAWESDDGEDFDGADK